MFKCLSLWGASLIDAIAPADASDRKHVFNTVSLKAPCPTVLNYRWSNVSTGFSSIFRIILSAEAHICSFSTEVAKAGGLSIYCHVY